MHHAVAHSHGPWTHRHHTEGPHRHRYLPLRSRSNHGHEADHGHGHTHGRIDPSISRSREGVRAVGASLVVLAVTAAAQAVVFLLSGSVALLADLIHNAGDALTAIPLGAAFLLRSRRAERWAGRAVVLAILVSAVIAGVEAVERLIHPHDLQYLVGLVVAGVLGFAGNELAARIRLRAGERLHSHALLADGAHARTDGFVSLGVIASAGLVVAGFPLGDPIVGLIITAVILRVTWQSWQTVRRPDP